MEKKGKKYTLKIKGKEVEVNEEIYRAYIRPVQAEQRQKRRDWKCKLISGVSESGKRHYVRCNKRCDSCPYYLSGQNALGNTFSLDKIIDEGVELRAFAKDVESDYIEEETTREEKFHLHKAIRQLTPRQQEMVKLSSIARVGRRDYATASTEFMRYRILRTALYGIVRTNSIRQTTTKL